MIKSGQLVLANADVTDGLYNLICPDQVLQPMPITNLLADVPASLPDELTQTLHSASGLRIERIVSQGHASPPDFWYDQDEHEWVLLLQGAATLRFEGEVVEIKPGDWMNIPAHQRHRLDWTTPDEPTIWLAVFYR